ncbi:hypothetical protein EAG_06641, partial [Camponotus floridanus]
VTKHKLLNHKFDWNKVEIVDEEPVLRKRLSEMIYIN